MLHEAQAYSVSQTYLEFNSFPRLFFFHMMRFVQCLLFLGKILVHLQTCLIYISGIIMYCFVPASLHSILCLWFIHVIACYNSLLIFITAITLCRLFIDISILFVMKICAVFIHSLLSIEYSDSGHYFSVVGLFTNFFFFFYNSNRNT